MKRPFPSMPTAQNRRRRSSKSSSLTPTLDFSDEDFVCGEADITEADGDCEKENDTPDDEEDECLKHEDCSECPYFCPMCGECRLEDED